jgi:hypothetical protein
MTKKSKEAVSRKIAKRTRKLYRVVDLFPARRSLDGEIVEGISGGGGAFLEGEIEKAIIISIPPTMSDQSVEKLRAALNHAWPNKNFHIVTQNIEFLSVERIPEAEAKDLIKAWDRWKAAEKRDAERSSAAVSVGAPGEASDPSDGGGSGVRHDGDGDLGAGAGQPAPSASPVGGDNREASGQTESSGGDPSIH